MNSSQRDTDRTIAISILGSVGALMLYYLIAECCQRIKKCLRGDANSDTNLAQSNNRATNARVRRPISHASLRITEDVERSSNSSINQTSQDRSAHTASAETQQAGLVTYHGRLTNLEEHKEEEEEEEKVNNNLNNQGNRQGGVEPYMDEYGQQMYISKNPEPKYDKINDHERQIKIPHNQPEKPKGDASHISPGL